MELGISWHHLSDRMPRDFPVLFEHLNEEPVLVFVFPHVEIEKSRAV